jgi:hypothetical protein
MIINIRHKKCDRSAGPYYPLGIIGTVPRAYDFLGLTKEWKGEKLSKEKYENLIQNKIQDFKNTIKKIKFQYNPTREVVSV